MEGYPLRLTWNSIEKMTEALGTPAFSQFDQAININNIGPVQLRIIIWAGLLPKYPELKQEDVSDLIDQYREKHGVSELYILVGNLLIEAGLLGKKGSDKGEVKTKQSKNS